MQEEEQTVKCLIKQSRVRLDASRFGPQQSLQRERSRDSEGHAGARRR